MAFRLMIWKGWLLRADNFINPCVPYFSFNRNVSHTSSVAEVTPKMIHAHWLMPTMYMMMKSTNRANSPPAKMKRYWLFSPLNSAGFPMPLFTGYLDIAAVLEEERTQDSGGDNQENTRPEPAGGGL